MKVIESFAIVPYYLAWHYLQGLQDYWRLAKRFIWFLWNYFSISYLLKNLISPFKRLSENYTRELDVSSWAESFILNSLMRFIGMIMRLGVICLGLVCMSCYLVLVVFGFFLWLILPGLATVIFVFGLINLFNF